MKKRLFLSAMALGMVAGVFAQSIEEGLKASYYRQNKKAIEVFGKLAAAKADDAEAAYWLGQAYLEEDDVVKAKDVYTKALTATNQNPLIIIGLGHIELLENKKAEAKAHFEAALEPSKSKKNKKYGDPKLLAAVGRANADGGSDVGDPDYGIEKLTQAAEIDTKDPEIMINLGLCYLKKGGEYGGKAKSAFEGALERDPKYALAELRIGKIFESQKNPDIFLEHYNKAIELDPAFAPGYLELYMYYSNRDVNKAKEYLDKYMANVPKDRETEYFYADYLLRAGRYQESLTAAKKIQSELNGDSYPKIHLLLSLNYDRLGDSTMATTELESYLKEEVPGKVSGNVYADMAGLYLKTNQLDKVDAVAEQAVAKDTAIQGKLDIISSVADKFGAAKYYKGEYKFRRYAMSIRPDTTARNFYFLINSAINAAEYAPADTFSQAYIKAYPDQAQGYYFRVKAATLADADTSKGTAIEAIDQYNTFLKADAEKNKSKIITNIGYKVYYYANKAKDYESAVKSLDEILAIDPENSYAKAGKDQLMKLLNKKAANTSAAKPAETSGK